MSGIKLYSIHSKNLPLWNQDQIQEIGILDSYVIWVIIYDRLELCNYSMDHPNLSHLHLFNYSLRIFKITGVAFQYLLCFFSLAGVFAGCGVCMFNYISPVTITKLRPLLKTHWISHPITQSHWQMMNLVHLWLFDVCSILVLYSWLNTILLCAVLAK